MGIKPQWDKNLTNSKLIITDVPQFTYLGETLTHMYQKCVKGMFTKTPFVENNKPKAGKNPNDTNSRKGH